MCPRSAIIPLLLLLAVGQARAETLLEAFADALETSPTLAAQVARLQQSQEKVASAQSHWHPTVGISAAAGEHHFRQSTSPDPILSLVTSGLPGMDSSSQFERDAQLTLTQPLYRGGQTVAETRAARASFAAERTRTLVVEASLLLDTATDYMDVVRDEAVFELQLSAERDLRNVLQGTREKFEHGQATRTDVAQAEARLAASVADREEAQSNLRTSADRYEETVGHPPGKLLAGNDGLPDLPPDLATAERLALARNPDLIARTYDARAAKYSVDELEGQNRPAVQLVVGASQDDNALIRTPQITNPRRIQNLSALLEVSIPLYDGGQNAPAVRAAKAAYRQATLEVELTRRSALYQLRSAWEGVQVARARLRSLHQQVDSDSTAVQGATAELAAGSRTLLDLLNAEHELVSSEVEVLKTEHDLTVGQFGVLATIGQLTPGAFGINGGFEPTLELPDT